MRGTGMAVNRMGMKVMAAVLVGITCTVGEATGETAGEVIERVGVVWTEAGWDQDLEDAYMRRHEDTGWQARMIGMQALVGMGENAVGPLVGVLREGIPGMRVFAAQTLSYLGPRVERSAFVQALADEDTAVRLYAVDGLGMSGAAGLSELLGPMRKTESDRDVRKHIDYAILRDGMPVDQAVIGTMLAWDAETITSATVGEMAPDFVFDALTGESIRLSSFVGKKAVVLVFIYGDT